MLLKNSEGVEFKMAVAGYQFPHVEDAKWDSDWLDIEIEVQHPLGSWSYTDACLLTWELGRLIEWLRKLARGEPVASEQDFMEPELRFELVSVNPKRLSIHLDYGMRPPWSSITETDFEGDDFCLAFEVEPKTLMNAADPLQDFLQTFPTRVGA